MDFDVPASTRMRSPPRRPTVTLTFDLQNLVRSSVATSEYFLQVSSTPLQSFLRYCANKICAGKHSGFYELSDERNGRTARKYNAFADSVQWQGVNIQNRPKH